MGYAKAKHFDPRLIPVIDITPLRDGTDPIGVSKSLHEASQNIGFIYIKGHGMSDITIGNARATALQFFKSKEADKSLVSVTDKHRGWLGPNRSRMRDDVKSDLKESFIWGLENNKINLTSDLYVFGDNKWPIFLPEMKKPAQEYFNQAQSIACHLLRGFALGLGLQENFFLQNVSHPLSRASYVYYPQQLESMGEEQFGAGPHTDFGVLTVLCQDAVGGLQIKDMDGDWVYAPPIEGTLIVNVGDLLSRWTDGFYRSTPHRVINQSSQERLSLVLAFDPNAETMIDARTIFGGEYLPKEEPISCGDYLAWRFSKAFS
ncbi:2OG-Fe(II) oxygenase [Gammaproteobacteria bacterium]|nr:2OG-Fe(II) oxygenase [Gammaproteobacteria bacterium]